MHTYRKLETGVWQVGHQQSGDFTPVGPEWDEEFLAAAFVCFLNGGRYSPGEIEPIFPKEYPSIEEDDDVHPARPRSIEDYPLAPKAK